MRTEQRDGKTYTVTKLRGYKPPGLGKPGPKARTCSACRKTMGKNEWKRTPRGWFICNACRQAVNKAFYLHDQMTDRWRNAAEGEQ